MMIKCDKCGTTFEPRDPVTGIPNGVGFFDDSGKTINICSNCITILCLMSDAGKRKFFESLGKKLKKEACDD